MTYRVYVTAINFNGEGPASTIVGLMPCSPPSGFGIPSIDYVSSTLVTISWLPPINDGGCGIQGYKIYLDDGLGGPFTEYDPTNVENKPFLSTYDIDMST